APGNGEIPSRRRGRRPSRRRRYGAENDLSPIAEPGADQPDLQPVYIGPTPADPFGGRAFDIFDVLEQAEERASTSATGMREPEPLAGADEDAIAEPTPEVTPRPSPDPAPEPAFASAPDEIRTIAEPVEEPPQAANDPAAEPAVKPIVIGAEETPPAERKRGWWRR
ncbi:MAG: hypothetical protein ACREF3_03970, partial [Acetobacteraceae bacterium]